MQPTPTMSFHAKTPERMASILMYWIGRDGWQLVGINTVYSWFLLWRVFSHYVIDFEKVETPEDPVLQIELGPVSDQVLSSQ